MSTNRNLKPLQAVLAATFSDTAYHAVATNSATMFGVILRNTLDVGVTVSTDGGTTDHLYLAAGDGLILDDIIISGTVSAKADTAASTGKFTATLMGTV